MNKLLKKLRRIGLYPRGRQACTGSTSVLALLVSLMLMVLVTATMAMTIVQVQVVQDYSRNAKSLQAADSGVVHGGATLAEALSAWMMPPATTVSQVRGYATDAENGDRANDRDISLIKASASNIDDVLPRDETTTTGYTDNGGSGRPLVRYDAAVDITPTGVTHPDPGDITERHVFHYDYTISSGGEAQLGYATNHATRMESGRFDVEVKRPSFSTYGYFTQGMKNQFNQQLVFFDGEVYSGPTHVNSAPPEGRAGFYGSPVFNGAFTAVQSSYDQSWLGGGANPQFNGGATWGVAQIELPSNGWSQARAALGDYSNIDNQTVLTNEQLRSKLGLNVNSDPVDPGVYYKNAANGHMLGGIYVQGDAASVQLSVSGSNQVIAITYKDSGGTAHSVVINDNAASNSCSVTKDGVADGYWNSSLNGVIHVEGNVKSLAGDSNESTGDVQSDQQMTVSATGNVIVTNHLTYQTDPRNTPGAKNILGIFSSNGNIYLGKNAPNDLKLHATVMAASTGHGVGTEGLVNGGSYDYTYANKGFWNLLGGLIENKNQTTGVYYSNGKMTGYKWNFTYDERFLNGVSPPYFPYVTKFTVSMLGKQAESWGRKYY
jgi:hypothetical protein